MSHFDPPKNPNYAGTVVRVERLAPRAYKAKSPRFLAHESDMLTAEVLDVEAEQDGIV